MKKYLFALLTIITFAACSTPYSKVEKVYKPTATNVFSVECEKSEQLCMKRAREKCNSDFEVITRDIKSGEGENAIYSLEFRCI